MLFSSYTHLADTVQNRVGSLGKVEPYSSEQCTVITNTPENCEVSMEKCKEFQTFPINKLRFYVIAGPT